MGSPSRVAGFPIATNAAPVAVGDSYSTPKNTTLVVAAPGVLANDTDADGDTLTATMVGDPAHGTRDASNADGAFTYTPDRQLQRPRQLHLQGQRRHGRLATPPP